MVIQDQSRTKRRLFVAGCSYSDYSWTTYPELLACDFDETYNYAMSGAGNAYIFNTLMFILERFKPTQDDLVIAQWSGIGRFDLILNDKIGYLGLGNITNQRKFSNEWVEEYFNVAQHGKDYVNYVNAVNYTAKALKTRIVNFNMFDPWIGNFYGEPHRASPLFEKKIDYVRQYYPINDMMRVCSLNNFEKCMVQFEWDIGYTDKRYVWYNHLERDEEGLEDHHPPPYVHYEFAKYLDKVLSLDCTNLYSDKTNEYVEFVNNFHKDKTNTINKAAQFPQYFDTSISVSSIKNNGPCSFFEKKFSNNCYGLDNTVYPRLI